MSLGEAHYVLARGVRVAKLVVLTPELQQMILEQLGVGSPPVQIIRRLVVAGGFPGIEVSRNLDPRHQALAGHEWCNVIAREANLRIEVRR